MNIKFRIICFLLLFFPYYCACGEVNEYEKFVKDFSGYRLSLIEKAGVLDGGHIYSSGEISSSVLRVGNAGLKAAGANLLSSLASSRSTFEQLPLEYLESVYHEALLLDGWLSDRPSWGNLVIKCYLLDYLIRGLFRNIENSKEDLKRLEKLKVMVLGVRNRIPSEWAALLLAKRHQGIDNASISEGLSLGVEPDTIRDAMEKEKFALMTSKDTEKQMMKAYSKENETVITSYQQLYYGEFVWRLASDISVYENTLWNLYVYLRQYEFFAKSPNDEFRMTENSFPEFIKFCCDNADDVEWHSKSIKNYIKRPLVDPYGYRRRFIDTQGDMGMSKLWDEDKGRFPFDLR